MTTLAVALIVTDAQKAAVEAAIAVLTPDYTIGFARPCCALSEPDPTWETPPTYWYANASAVDANVAAAWQEAVAQAGPLDPLSGLILFTAQNAENASGWAVTNLASQGLRFVPDEE
jgi:hypothetical protein